MKLFNHAKRIKAFKDDPLGFIIDTVISIVVNLIIPLPLAGEAAAQMKGPILGCLVGLVLMGLFVLIVLGTVILSPFLATENFLGSLLAPITSRSNIPADGSFVQTETPMQIPLGGNGLSYVSITAGFMDPAYFLTFGIVHYGVDLVPNDTYYANSQSYKDTHEVVVYATHSGTVNFYVDSYGAETVEVINDDGSIKTVYKHMKEVFVKTTDKVKAGSPLGIMGKTGLATAEHVHYEVRLKRTNGWEAVNPLQYIR